MKKIIVDGKECWQKEECDIPPFPIMKIKSKYFLDEQPENDEPEVTDEWDTRYFLKEMTQAEYEKYCDGKPYVKLNFNVIRRFMK